MARPLRIEYSGAWYHVMNRGINRMPIYLNEKHRKMFLDLLSEISCLFEIKIHGYCLMDNHYHLLIETPLPNLSKAMRHLSCVYTQRFNRLESRDGALFRGRYKAILVDSENYLLSISRYIHLNPTEANLVQKLSDYPWSSYNYYIKLNPPKWLVTSHILGFFESKGHYIKFVEEGSDKEVNNFYNFSKSSILGNIKFNKKHIDSLEEDYKKETQPDINHTIKILNIDSICNTVAKFFDVEVGFLKKTSKRNYPRMLAIMLAKNLTHSTHQKISEYFGEINKSSVSAAVIKCKKLIETKEELKQNYMRLLQQLYDES